MIDGKDITFYRKTLTSLMIFNTFEWLTLQVAFLPYPKNAETGRHHCLQNVFACKHACMQTQPAIWGCNCTAEDIAKI